MSDSTLQKVVIDRTLFDMAFSRDVTFGDTCPLSTFLDRGTGETFWVYENDEDASMDMGVPPSDNRAARERIEADANRFLEIPGLSHGDHHQIMLEFLNSNWTKYESARINARSAFHRSIGLWIKEVQDEAAVDAYFDFRDRKMDQLAYDFLRQNGIQPEWR